MKKKVGTGKSLLALSTLGGPWPFDQQKSEEWVQKSLIDSEEDECVGVTLPAWPEPKAWTHGGGECRRLAVVTCPVKRAHVLGKQPYTNSNDSSYAILLHNVQQS